MSKREALEARIEEIESQMERCEPFDMDELVSLKCEYYSMIEDEIVAEQQGAAIRLVGKIEDEEMRDDMVSLLSALA